MLGGFLAAARGKQPRRGRQKCEAEHWQPGGRTAGAPGLAYPPLGVAGRPWGVGPRDTSCSGATAGSSRHVPKMQVRRPRANATSAPAAPTWPACPLPQKAPYLARTFQAEGPGPRGFLLAPPEGAYFSWPSTMAWPSTSVLA